VVVESKNKDEEKMIFLSNSVNLAFEYGLKRTIKNIITKYEDTQDNKWNPKPYKPE
jgi:hypothetical protein